MNYNKAMKNIIDYIKEYGNLTLEEYPFNNVDSLILSQISYIKFENSSIDIESEIHLLSDFENEIDTLCIDTRVPELNEELFLQFIHSLRYEAITISHLQTNFDKNNEKQFCAMTFHLPNQTDYIAFRGTDSTMVGWKEDFNMSFVCPVPAQVLASRYVERLANEKNEKNIVITGHSKGGNLAVYAAAFCDDGVQKRITSVFNYDGPGFDDRVLRTESYKRICKRIMTFVPQSSVIGMLLGHEEAYTIVHSEQTGMMQHDVYSWDVRRDGFECLERVDNSSRFVDFTLKAWITDLDYKQRESFFDTVYTVMKETNASTLREMGENWFASAVSVLKSIKNLDEATRKAALRTLGLLVKCAGMGISHMWQTREKTEAPAKPEEKS